MNDHSSRGSTRHTVTRPVEDNEGLEHEEGRTESHTTAPSLGPDDGEDTDTDTDTYYSWTEHVVGSMVSLSVTLLKVAGSVTGKVLPPTVGLTTKHFVQPTVGALWGETVPERIRNWVDAFLHAFGRLVHVVATTPRGRTVQSKARDAVGSALDAFTGTKARAVLQDHALWVVQLGRALNTPESRDLWDHAVVLLGRCLDLASSPPTKEFCHDLADVVAAVVDLWTDDRTLEALAEVVADFVHVLEREDRVHRPASRRRRRNQLSPRQKAAQRSRRSRFHKRMARAPLPLFTNHHHHNHHNDWDWNNDNDNESLRLGSIRETADEHATSTGTGSMSTSMSIRDGDHANGSRVGISVRSEPLGGITLPKKRPPRNITVDSKQKDGNNNNNDDDEDGDDLSLPFTSSVVADGNGSVNNNVNVNVDIEDLDTVQNENGGTETNQTPPSTKRIKQTRDRGASATSTSSVCLQLEEDEIKTNNSQNHLLHPVNPKNEEFNKQPKVVMELNVNNNQDPTLFRHKSNTPPVRSSVDNDMLAKFSQAFEKRLSSRQTNHPTRAADDTIGVKSKHSKGTGWNLWGTRTRNLFTWKAAFCVFVICVVVFVAFAWFLLALYGLYSILYVPSISLALPSRPIHRQPQLQPQPMKIIVDVKKEVIITNAISSPQTYSESIPSLTMEQSSTIVDLDQIKKLLKELNIDIDHHTMEKILLHNDVQK